MKARRTGRGKVEVVIPGRDTDTFSVWLTSTYVDVMLKGRRAAALHGKFVTLPSREVELR